MSVTNPRLERMTAAAGIDTGLDWAVQRREARRHNRSLAAKHRRLPQSWLAREQRAPHAFQHPRLKFVVQHDRPETSARRGAAAASFRRPGLPAKSD